MPAFRPTSASAHEDDLDLARRLAPVIRFGANEPFLPSRVGATVITAPGRSPSAPLDLVFEPGVVRIVEYAIWWDWDIQHLYELEHVWIKLDAAGAIVGVDASAHGGLFPMLRPVGSLPIEDGRVVLYAEPGKHAFHAAPETILALADENRVACRELAGIGGILLNAMFRDALGAVSREDHRAVRRYLECRAFVPAYTFSQRFDLSAVEFVSWPDLAAWIPGRVLSVLGEVRATQPLLKAVFLDSGDTLVDEANEIRDADGYVTEADLIPGALDMVKTLHAEGYRLVLVADGHKKSFDTVLGHHGVRAYLDAEIISELMGCQKPDARMFEAALAALGLDAADAGQVAMLGNHLSRDIKGANQLGIISIWQNWSPRREKVPADDSEKPRHVVSGPGELPQLLAVLEQAMGRAARSQSISGALAEVYAR